MADTKWNMDLVQPREQAADAVIAEARVKLIFTTARNCASPTCHSRQGPS